MNAASGIPRKCLPAHPTTKESGEVGSELLLSSETESKLGLKDLLPISPGYRKPVFEALALQAVLGFCSLLILDGGTTARVCGIALVAFWGGAAVLIWRRPLSPTKTDIWLIRFGYLPLVVLAFFLVHFIWNLRSVE